MKTKSPIAIFREFLSGHFKACRVQFQDILAAVQAHFPELCDDQKVCVHEHANRPEWQHQVRHALDYMKNKQKLIFQETREEYVFP